LIRKERMQVKYSPLYKHDINSTIKRTKGVLTTRAIVLKLSNRLPDNISAEYYITTRYFLNRIPTRRIRYKTLIGGFLEKIGDTNWKPNKVQIRVFRCRVYIYNHTRNKLDKLNPKIYIG
jgi:hypothetical protein